LGHCSACHKQRNAFGATREAASVPGGHVDGWYAPSLHSAEEAGLQAMSVDAGARLLGAGAGADHVMLGPMAAVVFDSLQHLSHDDARAMATYLHELPEVTVEGRRGPIRPGEAALERQMIAGDRLYARHCADCHGDAGAGSDGVVALAGNRAVTQADPTNVVRIIRKGGFPAATEGNPYPHGMPPFPQLSDGEVAALTSYIRNSWGNNAAPITAVDGAQ
jgi:mono/diheme cytochrome c family protein